MGIVPYEEARLRSQSPAPVLAKGFQRLALFSVFSGVHVFRTMGIVPYEEARLRSQSPAPVLASGFRQFVLGFSNGGMFLI
jgi:hypothetical protein